jgi:adenylate kinase family enzyme
MTRVAVIGNAGGGKSTLCRKLSAALGIELFVIDYIQWRPGWVPTPQDEVRRAHDQILARERWIVDGWGPFDTIEARFAAADTIILVDHPLHVHYWWAIKRQAASLVREQPGIAPGCPLPPVTWRMLKLIWHVHKHMRPRLLSLVERYRVGRQVLHLRSPRELRGFVRQHAHGI